jgi:predicted O-methyltransferase YrrM
MKITVEAEIQNYAEKFTSEENEILQQLQEKTFSEREDKSSLSGFYQGRLLSEISKLIQPKRILEVGTYMGYSALCLAEGLVENGKIITLDIDEETNRIAGEFWALTPFYSRIESFVGDATQIIPTLDETFDLVFIDADKPNYANYYDLIFPKLRVGGVILADNVLWSGRVLHAETEDESTQALHEFNKKVQADERVSNVLLTVRDGLMLIRKDRD